MWVVDYDRWKKSFVLYLYWKAHTGTRENALGISINFPLSSVKQNGGKVLSFQCWIVPISEGLDWKTA